MGRSRTSFGAHHAIEVALDAHTTACARVPGLANDVDCFSQCGHGVPTTKAAAAHRLDRVPKSAGTEAELDAAVTEQIETRHAASQDRRWAQGQVGDIGRDRDRVRLRGNERHQRPRVEERWLVRMVLKRNEVKAYGLGQHREIDRVLRPRVGRCDEGTERKFVAVVGHVMKVTATGPTTALRWVLRDVDRKLVNLSRWVTGALVDAHDGLL